MSNRMLVDGFHFEKRAGRTVRGGRTEWEKAIVDMLSENHPYVLEGNPEWEIEWDEQDPENGMGRGKLIVWNREPLPPATPMESKNMDRMGVQDYGKSVTIPVFVTDFEIQDVDTFITDEGAANRLSDKRWSEVMGKQGEIGAIDPHTDPAKFRGQAPTYNLPGGAAGWDRHGYQGYGTMQKVSSQTQFPLLESALEELDPYDLERIKEAVHDERVVAGFGAGRLIPVIRVMLSTSPRSLVDIEDAACGELPPSIVYLQEIDKGPLSSRAAKFRATIVSDRYFHPHIVEGDYSMMVEALSGLVPDVGSLLRTPGNHVIELAGRTAASPKVIEDLGMGFGYVDTPGNWLCADDVGEMLQLDAVMRVMCFSGDETGQKLFYGNGRWAMANRVAGRKLSDALMHLHESSAKSGGELRRGEWVSIVIDGVAYDPAQVVYCGPFSGREHPSQLDLVTWSGEEVSVRFAPVLKVAPANGVKWPDVQVSTGCAKYLVPNTPNCRIVRLGLMTTLKDNPKAAEQLVQTYARASSMVGEAEGRLRFTVGTATEDVAHVQIRCFGTDYTLRGQLLKGVTGQDVVQNVSPADATYILCVLGCTKDAAETLLRRCESDARKTIHVAGLRPVCRTVDADGTRKVPFFQKAAELAVHLRDIVPDEDREVLFKAAAAIPIVELEEKVASLLEDDDVVRQMRFFGSVVPRFVELGAVEKLASNFADPESLDVMLGINALNERNVRSFLSKLATMRAVEDNLAELSMMSKLGLAGVEVSDVTEALDSLGRVNEALENVQAQLTQDKVTLGA